MKKNYYELKNRVLEEIYREISDIQKNKLQSYSADSATIELQDSIKSICQAVRDIIEFIDSDTKEKDDLKEKIQLGELSK